MNIILIILICGSLLMFGIVIRGFVRDFFEVKKADKTSFPLTNMIKINDTYESEELVVYKLSNVKKRTHKGFKMAVEHSEPIYQQQEEYSTSFQY